MANPLPSPVTVTDEYAAAILAELRALREEIRVLAQRLSEQSAPAPSVAPAVAKMTRKGK